MRVLQLIQKRQFRGAELFACQLSNCLLEQGQEVKLLCLVEGNAELPFQGKVVSLNRLLSNRFADVKGWKKLATEIENFNPDIVQANAGDTLKFAVLSKLFFKWKTPIVFRNASTISSYIKSSWVVWFNRFLFKRAAFVISVSEYTRQDFIRVFPFKKDKISVIPIGIHLQENRIVPQKESGYLLHVGGFTFEKNHAGLLSIMKRVVLENPTLELWLVGDGPLRPQVEQQVKELGIQKNVRLLGYQKDVMPFMKSASALLLPSIIEGLPGVILEAMYCHTPVVAYDVGGISEVVMNGETGWLVKAGDEVGFVKAIQEVLHSDDLETIKHQAYELVVKEYDNRVIAKRFLDVYESLLVGR